MEKEIKRLLRCFKKTELSEQDVTDAILKLIESNKAVLPQADVIKSVCDCERSKDIYMVEVYKCGECNLKVRT
jgi:hypothetical protein